MRRKVGGPLVVERRGDVARAVLPAVLLLLRPDVRWRGRDGRRSEDWLRSLLLRAWRASETTAEQLLACAEGRAGRRTRVHREVVPPAAGRRGGWAPVRQERVALDLRRRATAEQVAACCADVRRLRARWTRSRGLRTQRRMRRRRDRRRLAIDLGCASWRRRGQGRRCWPSICGRCERIARATRRCFADWRRPGRQDLAGPGAEAPPVGLLRDHGWLSAGQGQIFGLVVDRSLSSAWPADGQIAKGRGELLFRSGRGDARRTTSADLDAARCAAVRRAARKVDEIPDRARSRWSTRMLAALQLPLV